MQQRLQNNFDIGSRLSRPYLPSFTLPPHFIFAIVVFSVATNATRRINNRVKPQGDV
jgi:hypothetical protein